MNAVLHSRVLIKKLLTIFLFGVFLLGITPRKTLHNLWANHTDNTSKSNDGKAGQINKSGFNCRCEDLVAESNFMAGVLLTITAPVLYHKGFTFFYNSFLSLSHIRFNLRGPPVQF